MLLLFWQNDLIVPRDCYCTLRYHLFNYCSTATTTPVLLLPLHQLRFKKKMKKKVETSSKVSENYVCYFLLFSLADSFDWYYYTCDDWLFILIILLLLSKLFVAFIILWLLFLLLWLIITDCQSINQNQKYS